MNATLNILLNYITQLVIKNNEIYSVQPFGSIPNRSNSLRPKVLSQFARLIPDFWAVFSNCSFNSGDIRILNCGDCPSPFGLLSRFIIDKWSPIELALYVLGGHLNTVKPIKSTPSNSAINTERGLTTNDNDNIEVAMYQYTFLIGKDKVRLSEITSTPLISIQEVSHA
ncbi:conserved hypothetical protein [Xenorhabdus bovienii str. kraussei Quebec]|uniref:Uncharacterized protein n=2 Tax=Xenorhabdus bovienii TaxID=40576 RepID=A0A077P606_XENBV|nr:conserved hypothetical protein [Xenorhabdus bovienii str. kraussei Quebec]